MDGFIIFLSGTLCGMFLIFPAVYWPEIIEYFKRKKPKPMNEIDKKLEPIIKRLVILENPFKYNIGDIVNIKAISTYYSGTHPEEKGAMVVALIRTNDGYPNYRVFNKKTKTTRIIYCEGYISKVVKRG